LAHLPDAEEQQGLGREGSSADFVALSEIIGALINFKVYNAELVGLCDRCVEMELNFHSKSVDSSSSSARRLYDIGRLEGFLVAYRALKVTEQKKFTLFGKVFSSGGD